MEADETVTLYLVRSVAFADEMKHESLSRSQLDRATEIGLALHHCGVKLATAHSSNEVDCIQTAQAIMQSTCGVPNMPLIWTTDDLADIYSPPFGLDEEQAEQLAAKKRASHDDPARIWATDATFILRAMEKASLVNDVIFNAAENNLNHDVLICASGGVLEKGLGFLIGETNTIPFFLAPGEMAKVIMDGPRVISAVKFNPTEAELTVSTVN